MRGQALIMFIAVLRNQGLNEHVNFERFWMALLTLLKMATQDNWADVFTGCMASVSTWGAMGVCAHFWP